MLPIIHKTEYRSILCLNGELPDANFFRHYNLPVIAADGAANHLIKIGIKPYCVVGDLDSVEASILDKIETHYHYNQDFCDFEKTLEYATSKNLLPCIILGMSGGCLDHVLNNINIFMKSNNVFYAPPLYGFILNESDNRSFDLALNTKLSILGIPSANVTTKGLRWNLSRASLSFPGMTSCLNQTIEKSIQITVHEGSILLLIYE